MCLVERIRNQKIRATKENLAWEDCLSYQWPSFEAWLIENEFTESQIEEIRDDFYPSAYLQVEHASGFYSVAKNQYVFEVVQEFEDCLEGYTEDEIKIIEEEFVVQGELFYIYNPTAFYISKTDVLHFLSQN